MSDFLKIGDDGPKLDTAAMASAGKALLNGTTPASTPTTPSSTPAAVPVQSTVTVTPVEQPVTAANPAALQSQQPATPQAQQPATEAAAETPTYVTGDDNALVELTINGQKQVMKFGEAKKQMMLHSTFTQNQLREPSRPRSSNGWYPVLSSSLSMRSPTRSMRRISHGCSEPR